MKCNRLFFLIILLTACSSRPKVPDKDYTKSMAVPIEIGATVDDKVDEDNDSTDWKRFKIEDPGPLKINVYWDNYKHIKAVIGLYNGLGVKIKEIEHDPDSGARKDTIFLKNAQPGAYFVMIRAKDGASVYTIEVLAGDLTEGSTYGVPRPE